MTHALGVGSPAINHGSNPAGLTNDQRGPGFFRFAGSAVDIGAFEVQSPGAKITAVQVNLGAAQRSMVTTLKVTFDQLVALPANPADAFQLNRQSDNASVTLSASVSGNDVTLTFTGGAVNGASLADGRYTLTALASKISFGNFDGNGDGFAGEDFTLTGAPGTASNLFRLFGDVNGDGTVAASDFIVFRKFFGGSNFAFDFDNDGAVAASDFIQFRLRFGGSI